METDVLTYVLPPCKAGQKESIRQTERATEVICRTRCKLKHIISVCGSIC